MSTIVYRITCLLAQVLEEVPIGTNLGLFHLLFALLSGRLLPARGAVIPALSSLGLSAQVVLRSNAALCYGCWNIHNLLDPWQKRVKKESVTWHLRQVWRGIDVRRRSESYLSRKRPQQKWRKPQDLPETKGITDIRKGYGMYTLCIRCLGMIQTG